MLYKSRAAQLSLALVTCIGVTLLALTFFRSELSQHYITARFWLADLAAPENALVMAGDSLISSGEWQAYFPKHTVLNRGIYGEDSAELAARVEALVDLQPAQLFILIGINDLNKGLPLSQTEDNLRRLYSNLDRRLPQCEVTIIGLLPTNPAWKIKLFAEDMHTLNALIERLASQYDFQFADVAASLGEFPHSLHADFTTDGLHLNEAGYRALAKALSDHFPPV